MLRPTWTNDVDNKRAKANSPAPKALHSSTIMFSKTAVCNKLPDPIDNVITKLKLSMLARVIPTADHNNGLH